MVPVIVCIATAVCNMHYDNKYKHKATCCEVSPSCPKCSHSLMKTSRHFRNELCVDTINLITYQHLMSHNSHIHRNCQILSFLFSLKPNTLSCLNIRFWPNKHICCSSLYFPILLICLSLIALHQIYAILRAEICIVTMTKYGK